MQALNIAHRGGAALRPENTLVAFQNAIVLGADGAELDVQLSADGVVIVHHDPRLNPGYARRDGAWLSGETPLIKDLTLSALKAFDLGRPDPNSDYARLYPDLTPVDGAQIPTLAEVRDAARAAPKPFVLFVELKFDKGASNGEVAALADAALEVMKDDLSHTVFVGFDWRGLIRIKHAAPMAQVWFSTDKLDGDLHPIIAGISASMADGWFPHYANATPDYVDTARALGLKVGAWTVNDPADMRRLSDLDAICTDRPDVLATI